LSASEAQTSHRYVPLADAATYAGVPPGTVRDWIRRGILPAYRIGPRLLQVNLDDIDDLRRPVATAAKPAGKASRKRRNRRKA
jgi:excisionase family DNA binding protein